MNITPANQDTQPALLGYPQKDDGATLCERRASRPGVRTAVRRNPSLPQLFRVIAPGMDALTSVRRCDFESPTAAAAGSLWSPSGGISLGIILACLALIFHRVPVLSPAFSSFFHFPWTPASALSLLYC